MSYWPKPSIKTCWYIVNKPNITPDDKTRLQATAIINDSYKYIMDLVTNGSVITNAIKHITELQNNVNIINKVDESQEALEEETTTNGVF